MDLDQTKFGRLCSSSPILRSATDRTSEGSNHPILLEVSGKTEEDNDQHLRAGWPAENAYYIS